MDRHHTRPSGASGSCKYRADGDRKAAQKLFGCQWRASGALDLEWPDRLLTGANGQLSVQHLTRFARAIGDCRLQQFDALAARLEPCTRRWRESANLALDLGGGAAPVDHRLGLVDLGRIG